MRKPNVVDKNGNDCIHLSSSDFFIDGAYLCGCGLPDCIPDCRWFYIDHQDLPEVPDGEIISRLIWFCHTHKCECEL